MKDQFILACREYFVNNGKSCRHPRKRAEEIPAESVARRPKARGMLVARAERRHQLVRIPAMSCAELGHLLRSLELTRACA